jgi:transposase
MQRKPSHEPLSPEKVRRILKLYDGGVNIRSIAVRFGHSYSWIWEIVRNHREVEHAKNV